WDGDLNSPLALRAEWKTHAMRLTLAAALVACIVPGRVAPAPGDDQAKAQAVIDQSIEALGGKEKVTKFKAATWRIKGTFYGHHKGLAYTAEWMVQPPEQARVAVISELDGRKYQRIMGINGDKGWIQMNDDTEEMDPERLAEEKEQLYANWVATVVP